MSIPYDRILPRAFKLFSLKTALRTGLSTMGSFAKPLVLPVSEKPALFTMNILPAMAVLWHHFVRKNLGDIDCVLFDCSGRLDPRDVPGIHVRKFLNFYAATKCDIFLRSIARNRRHVLLMDDDIFPQSPRILEILKRELAQPNTASVSFRPRDWWHFDIDGKSIEVSGSYCLGLNRQIFVDDEHLSLAPCSGNTHPSNIGKLPLRYDTFDKANETLLQKRYRCVIASKAEREECLTGFSGMSGAVVMLDYFKKSEDVLDFFRSAPKERWSGNILFGTLSGLRAIARIQELAKLITGKAFPLPTLPAKDILDRIFKEHIPFMRTEHPKVWVEEITEKLERAL